MRFQRVTQSITLTLFTGLLLLAAYPFPEGLPVDLFLRLDPLLAAGTALVIKDVALSLAPGLLVLASSFILGRYFCAHVCPMGTTLDLLERPLVGRRRRSAEDSAYEADGARRSWKYLILGSIVAAALVGISLVHLGSPLSLVTRFYGLCLYPVALLLGESSLTVASPLFTAFGFHDLALVQIQEKVFATNAFVAVAFVGIILLGHLRSRFWCRNLCPAGALMGLCSRNSLVKRRVNASCTRCRRCVRSCPTGAIGEDPLTTAHAECIVCLRCMEICPEKAVSFGIAPAAPRVLAPSDLPTHRRVFLAAGVGLVVSGLFRTSIHRPKPLDKERALVEADLIRPPGALPEAEFLARCVRCGECMKACPTNTLQPVWLKAGLEGIFTPVMVPRLAACALGCTVCGTVCPTGAIRALPLEEKQHAKVGTAWIFRQKCLVWEQDKKCLVCDEACPYNAVSFQPVPELRNAAPFVVENRCTGCGWCETRCPVEGASAIQVSIIGEMRLVSGSYREKAAEYGYVFKTKDNSADGLAPDTFDAPESFVPDGNHSREP
ncbi:MAG: 4Fe-4S binding protein [Desulfomonile sp.]|nr:4Fe-4S binding protein [Desulfomonile sp.]